MVGIPNFPTFGLCKLYTIFTLAAYENIVFGPHFGYGHACFCTG